MNSRRSASVGALPREKVHYVSRNESASGMSLDVRCACQFFESDSLLPERSNPVDSRPTSKLGYHMDVGLELENQMNFLNADAGMQFENMSQRSFNVGGGHIRSDMERQSVRSFGGVQSAVTAPIDLSFVEKDPVLEETARSRGLVVKSIEDHNVSGNSRFMAGHRKRQMSETSLGMRDPETMSMRSVTSLRRISCSSSKKDLFVADLNIPDARRDQRSANTSRRTSNMDLTHLGSTPTMTSTAYMSPPQFNLIAATPSVAAANIRPDFQRSSRSVSPARRATGEEDYRIAKPPASVDYMRPDPNKFSTEPYKGEVAPQNRPIDVSKYGGAKEATQQPSYDFSSPMGSWTVSPQKDALEQTVQELEFMAATHNIKDIRDDIRSETKKPDSVAGDIYPPSLHPGEEIDIDIVSSIPMVDIDRLIQMEREKAEASRQRSKTPTRPFAPDGQNMSMLQMDTLKLPSGSSRKSSTPERVSQIQLPQKRPHTPDRTMGMQREQTPAYETGATESKSYGSRFKSMFSSKPKENTPIQIVSPEFRTVAEQQSLSPNRNRSPSPARNTSLMIDPIRNRSPSPARNTGLQANLTTNRSPSPARNTGLQTTLGTNRSPSPARSFSTQPANMDLQISSPNRNRSPSPGRSLLSQFNKTKSLNDNLQVDTKRDRSSSPGRTLMSRFGKTKEESSNLLVDAARDRSPSPGRSLISRFSKTKEESPNLQVNAIRDRSPTPGRSLMSRFGKSKEESSNLQVDVTRDRSPSPGRSLMSRFTKSKDESSNLQVDVTRDRSPSPGRSLMSRFTKTKDESSNLQVDATRDRSPSPGRSLLSRFSKSKQKQKPEAIEIMGGTNAVQSKKPTAELMSVKVTETFSLKVDEMDQYTSRPAKQAAPPPSLGKQRSESTHSRSSHEITSSSFDHDPQDISQAFVPIISSQAIPSAFVGTNRTLYSSEIDTISRRSDASKEPSLRGSQQHFPTNLPRGALVSVPINLSDDNLPPPGVIAFRGSSQQLAHTKSSSGERRIGQSMMFRKTSFMEGRTQSHDRTRLSGSQDDVFGSRMTKTVSFHFDERKSRLSQFENSDVSDKQKEKQDFIDRTYFSRDHEYEPIGDAAAKEASVATHQLEQSTNKVRDGLFEAKELQKEMEDAYLSSGVTTPRTESRVTDYEIHTSQVDTSALEELPLKPENRKKSLMASAKDRTSKMQAGFKTQAGKIKTKLRTPTKKAPSGSPKAKDRKRFKAPEFSKMKLPEMSKLKDFKRPEFTKFNKPDMSMFKLPEKFSTLKLRRSKSFKENETMHDDDESGLHAQTEATATAEPESQQKKILDFNFGTFPRAFRRKKKPSLVETQSSFGTNDPSIVTSTATPNSVESSSSPQGDRGPGPVRSRWADKFSDVSYNDSEGSRYRRYGSELESFDRESSLERRMKEDLEETETGSEAVPEMGILGGVSDNRQFAEFDEENRAIHEISNLRRGEFKRRPMIHQDSDLRSEDSKDVEGWTEKEVQKNKLLRKAELEAEASYLKYPSVDRIETQSTASSGKKVVMEEIDDDEFFLRKRGVSEDNSELRQYISNAIREGYDMPINALQHVGTTSEPLEYGDYDVPPPKPKRLHKHYLPHEESQEFEMPRSDYGDDLSTSQNGSHFVAAPKRPMRKGRSRSKYSLNSEDVSEAPKPQLPQYFDDDEEYLRPPAHELSYKETNNLDMNNFDYADKEVYEAEMEGEARPDPPRRRKRQDRESSTDKDSYVNGFGGRSVSNSYLQPTHDVIVYRTEHEYRVPLATPDNYTDNGSSHISMDAQLKSQQFDEEEFAEQQRDEKFVIDMMENDGYATVRKEPLPKPTPPARRKKFSRLPGERFATLPNMRTKRSTPPPERPPPPRSYTPSTMLMTDTTDAAEKDQIVAPRRKSAISLDAPQNRYKEDDYEELQDLNYDRPESPRNLQSGEVINKMKFRPLPPPPRPPREKRNQRAFSKGSEAEDSNFGEDGMATSSVADSYDQNADFEEETHIPEVEVSTQTDPLPDDFVCEEFEITDDMKVIEPRRPAKTLEELLRQQEQQALDEAEEPEHQMTEEEQLARGLQRFRDANQRSISEKSRGSSLSRPQTPSAVVIERRISTPVPSSQQNESMVEASLIVRPIDIMDDLDLEEEALRREGLLSDSSAHSKSDVEESRYQGDDVVDFAGDAEAAAVLSDYSHELSSVGQVSVDMEAMLEELRTQSEVELEENDEEVERTLRDYTSEISEKYSLDEQASVEDLHETESQILSDTEVQIEADVLSDTEVKIEAEVLSDTELHIEAEVIEEEPMEEQRTMRDISYKLEDTLEDKPEEFGEESKIPLEESDVMVEDFVLEERRMVDTQYELEQKPTEEVADIPAAALTEENEYESLEERPLPPPRRKSNPTLDPAAQSIMLAAQATEVSNSVQPTTQVPQIPTHLGELEVERLRVHALQAGQIMVSQLHGGQISTEQLDCNSSHLVVNNIELPPGFIENIVERVRSTERGPLLTVETQTSLQASSEMLLSKENSQSPVRELVPPPKPPRQRDLAAALERHVRNYDEQTQTEEKITVDSATSPQQQIPAEPPVYASSVEYLRSLPDSSTGYAAAPSNYSNVPHEDNASTHSCHGCHHHCHHHHRCYSSSSQEEEHALESTEEPQHLRRRTRSRSRTHPPSEASQQSHQSVVKAGSQFISACGLSLVNIINNLTDCVRGVREDDQTGNPRLRQVPTLVLLFVVITFSLLLYLLSGRSVHTHHWDYFNPPGNEGREQ